MKPSQIKSLSSALVGNITSDKDRREFFSTDGSLIRVMPSAVIYPHDVRDIQAIVAYARDQSRKESKKFTLVARGGGTNTSGGAIGGDAAVVFPAYIKRLKRLSRDSVTVQAGMPVEMLRTILFTHERAIPPLAGMKGTIGGAVANNSVSASSYKYGSMAAWVTRLKVVLDDGTLIETKRISRRELNHKKGLMTREGDLYRGIDGLIQDHAAIIKGSQPKITHNSAGYLLGTVKDKDGSVDLTPLFIGSQGTLGMITEITLRLAVHEPRMTLVTASFSSLRKAETAIDKLHKLQPCAVELIDISLLEFIQKQQPEVLDNFNSDEPPEAIMIIAFDNTSYIRQNMLSRRAERVLKPLASDIRVVTQNRDQEKVWRVLRTGLSLLASPGGAKQAVPCIEDLSIPTQKTADAIKELRRVFKKHKLEFAIWSHAGSGNVHAYPLLDTSKPADRKKLLSLMDEIYNYVIKSGGSTSAGQGDGILRSPYLEKQYGKEMYQVLKEIKAVCDPHGIFNPMAKLGTTKTQLVEILRHDYRVNL